MLEIGTTIISAVFRSVSSCHRRRLAFEVLLQVEAIVVLLGLSVTVYAFLNGSRTANNVEVKQCAACS
jgi:hypothetical protein